MFGQQRKFINSKLILVLGMLLVALLVLGACTGTQGGNDGGGGSGVTATETPMVGGGTGDTGGDVTPEATEPTQ